MIRSIEYFRDMNFVVLLLLAQLFTSCVSLSNGEDTLNLADLSDSSVKGLFEKYSKNETYIRFRDFESFLNKFIHIFGHKNVDNHSYDDYSHDNHSHDDHSHENSTKTLERKFLKCFENKLLKLKKVSGDNYESLEKREFSQLSSIFVSDLDQCIEEKTVLNDSKDLVAKKVFSSTINFKRESKTIC